MALSIILLSSYSLSAWHTAAQHIRVSSLRASRPTPGLNDAFRVLVEGTNQGTVYIHTYTLLKFNLHSDDNRSCSINRGEGWKMLSTYSLKSILGNWKNL